MYGYTQAKALVYSKYGEPKDVLKYVGSFPKWDLDLESAKKANRSKGCINTPFPPPMAHKSTFVFSPLP